MVEKYANKKCISGMVVWLLIVFLLCSLIAILLTSLITNENKSIVASADAPPYTVFEPVKGFENYPTFDMSNLTTPWVNVLGNSYHSSGVRNPFDATGFNLDFFLDVSPEKNQLVPYNALGIKREVGTTPTHRYQAGGWFSISNPHLKIMTACSHAEYYPSIEIHYYDSTRTYIQSQSFVPLYRYTPNKIIWQEYDISTNAPANCAEWVYDLIFKFTEGGDNTRYYLFPVLTFQTSVIGVRSTEFILDCFDYWYGINDESWRIKYLHQLEINDMIANGGTLEGALTSITATPINLLKDLLSFEIEILGINIKQLLIFVLSLAVVGVVIKIIIGRS